MVGNPLPFVLVNARAGNEQNDVNDEKSNETSRRNNTALPSLPEASWSFGAIAAEIAESNSAEIEWDYDDHADDDDELLWSRNRRSSVSPEGFLALPCSSSPPLLPWHERLYLPSPQPIETNENIYNLDAGLGTNRVIATGSASPPQMSIGMLSADICVMALSYLDSVQDLLPMQRVCRSWTQLIRSAPAPLFDVVEFDERHHVLSDEDLVKFLRRYGYRISRLSLRHCQQLSPQMLRNLPELVPQLDRLDISGLYSVPRTALQRLTSLNSRNTKGNSNRQSRNQSRGSTTRIHLSPTELKNRCKLYHEAVFATYQRLLKWVERKRRQLARFEAGGIQDLNSINLPVVILTTPEPDDDMEPSRMQHIVRPNEANAQSLGFRVVNVSNWMGPFGFENFLRDCGVPRKRSFLLDVFCNPQGRIELRWVDNIVGFEDGTIMCIS